LRGNIIFRVWNESDCKFCSFEEWAARHHHRVNGRSSKRDRNQPHDGGLGRLFYAVRSLLTAPANRGQRPSQLRWSVRLGRISFSELRMTVATGPMDTREGEHIHTSDLLVRLIDEAPRDSVDLDWLLRHLEKRAFGLLLLILAIAISVPGLGIVACVVIVFPAVEMMLARDRPTLPRFLTKRSFDAKRLSKLAERSLPLLRRVERVSRSRWHTPVEATKRAVGLLVLALAISAIGPLPLINIPPALTIALVAIAYLQEDGLLLGLAFAIGILLLAIFGFLIWTSTGAVEDFFAAWTHVPWAAR
jgi:hypothetical protein